MTKKPSRPSRRTHEAVVTGDDKAEAVQVEAAAEVATHEDNGKPVKYVTIKIPMEVQTGEQRCVHHLNLARIDPEHGQALFELFSGLRKINAIMPVTKRPVATFTDAVRVLLQAIYDAAHADK